MMVLQDILMKKKYILIFLVLMALAPTLVEADTSEVDIGTVYQGLEGFGASHVWSGSTLLALGDNNPEIYDVLFGELGLDIVRLRNNYGYGDEFDYDYIGNCAHAITNGRDRTGRPLKILISSWSPPASLKSTNNINGNNSATLLKSGGNYLYSEFGTWWADSVEHYASLGMVPDYISIQNEPDFSPNNYEGCRFDPTESSTIAGYDQAFEAVYDELYSRMGSAMPKMIGPETTGFLGASGPAPSEYISALNLSHVYGYAHHLYNCNDGGLAGCASHPDNYISTMTSFGTSHGDKPILQTEYSDDNYVTPYDACINLAVLIHNSLVEEGAAGYLYWQLTWGDGGLVRISTDSWTINAIYYAMWHFSRFTDPGWRRVQASNNSGDLRISAYLSPDKDELSIIVINTASKSIDLSLSLGGFSSLSSEVYQTTEAEQAAYIGAFDESDSLSLPGWSITTINLNDGSQGTPYPTGTPTATPSPAPTDVPVDCSNAPEWNPVAIYDSEGIKVVYNGNLYVTNWYSSGHNPEENSGNYEVWTLLGPCGSQITTGPTTEPTATPVETPGPDVTPGDVNSDREIDIVDALLIAQCYVGLSSCPSLAIGDTNCDDTIDIVDALLIAQYYVGLISGFCN